MYRLMKDAEKLGATFNSEFFLTEKGALVADFADITAAIHTVQTEMGITGTTAAEAGSTIQGSIASLMAAWTNFAVGIADENSNMSKLMDNLVNSVTTVGENLMPRIMQVLEGIGTLIPQVAPIIIDVIPQIIEQIIPTLLDGAVSIVTAVVQALPTILQTLINEAPSIVRTLADAIIDSAPLLITAVPQLLFALIEGFFDNIGEIKQIGEDLVRGIWEGISSMARWIRENVNDLFNSIVDGVKDLLGIHSPSTVFAEMGKNMALGVGEGWDKSFSDIKAGIEDGMNFEGDYYATATSNGTGAAGAKGGHSSSIGDVTVYVNGLHYYDERELAEAIGYQLQAMTERGLAVFG